MLRIGLLVWQEIPSITSDFFGFFCDAPHLTTSDEKFLLGAFAIKRVQRAFAIQCHSGPCARMPLNAIFLGASLIKVIKGD
ncbi:MAG: hypothetical protein IKB90_03145 [Alistipes sp.]|nr:hypothetical protein [Alistipes sp.]